MKYVAGGMGTAIIILLVSILIKLICCNNRAPAVTIIAESDKVKKANMFQPKTQNVQMHHKVEQDSRSMSQVDLESAIGIDDAVSADIDLKVDRPIIEKD